ncbi:tetratricopeptide repeat protein [Pseudoduganella flava]|uniref:Response regulator n=1 Tax=Pseudoduganella flava TaxID=871742 RepID=A0A562PN18_9BURK|nr:tetratricopeptide repeat-containing response regulator [Pseudoduganella flava]QGZ40742.1 response regulator [Pseudoduganella flava]TWI45817.1 tetratricopeptide repeat protein [Pseudoduganella flava]
MTQLNGLTALLVEPNAAIRSNVQNMLNLLGLARVEVATSAQQAIRALAARPVDLILCEYELEGGQDGQQLLEDLRQQELIAPATLFFMVTAEGLLSKVTSVAELMPDDYVLKPFKADTLLARIERALERRATLLPVQQLLERGEHRAAIAACVEQEKEQPRYKADFMRLRAETHLLLGEPEQAEHIYAAVWNERAIPWARLGQAKTLALRGHVDAARAMLSELLGHNDRFLAAYDWLARVHEEAGELAEAQAVLSDAATLSPHAVGRLRRLGEVALEAGDADAAERALKQVLQRARNSEFRNPEDHARLAQSLLRKGDTAQAELVIRDMERQLANRETTPVCAAIATAMLLEATGDTARLGQALDTALAGARLAPNLSAGMKLELARTCLAAGREQQAAEVMKSVMASAGGGAPMAKAMRLLEQTGKGDLANQLAKESRHAVATMVAQGAAQAKAGDLRGAVDTMLDAVHKLPGNPQVVFNAAVAVLKYLERAGWDEHLGTKGLELVSNLRRLDPGNPKLAALGNLQEELLRKYNVRPGRRIVSVRQRA